MAMARNWSKLDSNNETIMSSWALRRTDTHTLGCAIHAPNANEKNPKTKFMKNILFFSIPSIHFIHHYMIIIQCNIIRLTVNWIVARKICLLWLESCRLCTLLPNALPFCRRNFQFNFERVKMIAFGSKFRIPNADRCQIETDFKLIHILNGPRHAEQSNITK